MYDVDVALRFKNTNILFNTRNKLTIMFQFLSLNVRRILIYTIGGDYSSGGEYVSYIL